MSQGRLERQEGVHERFRGTVPENESHFSEVHFFYEIVMKK